MARRSGRRGKSSPDCGVWRAGELKPRAEVKLFTGGRKVGAKVGRGEGVLPLSLPGSVRGEVLQLNQERTGT